MLEPGVREQVLGGGRGLWQGWAGVSGTEESPGLSPDQSYVKNG